MREVGVLRFDARERDVDRTPGRLPLVQGPSVSSWGILKGSSMLMSNHYTNGINTARSLTMTGLPNTRGGMLLEPETTQG
jgi:hypothetical protein